MGKELKPLKQGQRFGMLTVVGKDEDRTKERKKQYYFCQCDCGSPIKSIMKASLVSKTRPTYSCGCHSKYTQGYIDDREMALSKLLYGKIKIRHTTKLKDKEETLISFDDFNKLIKQPCNYCGAVGFACITDRRNKEVKLYYNGLDRVDSTIGYRLSNVVPACRRCNVAKSEFTLADFKEHIIRIHNYQKRKSENAKTNN